MRKLYFLYELMNLEGPIHVCVWNNPPSPVSSETLTSLDSILSCDSTSDLLKQFEDFIFKETGERSQISEGDKPAENKDSYRSIYYQPTFIQKGEEILYPEEVKRNRELQGKIYPSYKRFIDSKSSSSKTVYQ